MSWRQAFEDEENNFRKKYREKPIPRWAQVAFVLLSLWFIYNVAAITRHHYLPIQRSTQDYLRVNNIPFNPNDYREDPNEDRPR